MSGSLVYINLIQHRFKATAWDEYPATDSDDRNLVAAYCFVTGVTTDAEELRGFLDRVREPVRWLGVFSSRCHEHIFSDLKPLRRGCFRHEVMK